jgi:hypothetical protein
MSLRHHGMGPIQVWQEVPAEKRSRPLVFDSSPGEIPAELEDAPTLEQILIGFL